MKRKCSRLLKQKLLERRKKPKGLRSLGSSAATCRVLIECFCFLYVSTLLGESRCLDEEILKNINNLVCNVCVSWSVCRMSDAPFLFIIDLFLVLGICRPALNLILHLFMAVLNPRVSAINVIQSSFATFRICIFALNGGFIGY